jgi:hypothetical protein
VLIGQQAPGSSVDSRRFKHRNASAGHPLKPRTIQTALGELEAAGSEEGTGRARYRSPTTPIRMPTAPATIKRAMVERAWHDPPGNVLDRGLAEPAHGTSQVALVRLVVTDLPPAPRKKRPHERSAAPREPGGLAGMLDGWSR